MIINPAGSVQITQSPFKTPQVAEQALPLSSQQKTKSAKIIVIRNIFASKLKSQNVSSARRAMYITLLQTFYYSQVNPAEKRINTNYNSNFIKNLQDPSLGDIFLKILQIRNLPATGRSGDMFRLVSFVNFLNLVNAYLSEQAQNEKLSVVERDAIMEKVILGMRSYFPENQEHFVETGLEKLHRRFSLLYKHEAWKAFRDFLAIFRLSSFKHNTVSVVKFDGINPLCLVLKPLDEDFNCLFRDDLGDDIDDHFDLFKPWERVHDLKFKVFYPSEDAYIRAIDPKRGNKNPFETNFSVSFLRKYFKWTLLRRTHNLWDQALKTLIERDAKQMLKMAKAWRDEELEWRNVSRSESKHSKILNIADMIIRKSKKACNVMDPAKTDLTSII